MSKCNLEIIPVIIENQQKNIEIGRVFYRFLQEELKRLKGEIKNENK